MSRLRVIVHDEIVPRLILSLIVAALIVGAHHLALLAYR